MHICIFYGQCLAFECVSSECALPGTKPTHSSDDHFHFETRQFLTQNGVGNARFDFGNSWLSGHFPYPLPTKKKEK